jgi:parallel beta-helix repeat protein
VKPILKLSFFVLLSLQAVTTQAATTVTKIAAGADHSLFLKSDGSLWGMGDNSSGQLGAGFGVSSTNRPLLIVSNGVFNQNNGAGLLSGAGCTVKDCVARLNTAQGIAVDDGSTITGCTVSTNTISGLSGGNGCVINNCTVSYNGAPGGLPAVNFGFSSSITGCAVFRNKSTGILAGDGSTIRNCTLRENGGDGILMTNACVVVDNACQSNGSGGGTLAGIHAVGATNRIDGNNVTFNLTRGIKVDADHNLVIRNSAKDNSVLNFDITGGSYGQIYSTPGAAFTNSNPWANFSY